MVILLNSFKKKRTSFSWNNQQSIIADDTDGLAGEAEKQANLAERLDKASTAYSMEISAKKTKLMTNNTSGIHTEIAVDRSLRQSQTSSTRAQL